MANLFWRDVSARKQEACVRLSLILGVLAIRSSAFAAGIDSHSYMCAAPQSMIAAKGFVFIYNSNFADFAVANASYCAGGGTEAICSFSYAA